VVFLFARDAVAAADAERQVAVVGGKVAEGLGGSYLAVPDLLRHEIREGTTLGLQLAEMIKMGKIVPPSQSVELLQRAMGERPGPFVVEGFPKSADNLRLWEEAGGSCKAALYLELADDAYSAKEVAAGKAQEDVDRRMRAFKAQTQPAIDALAGKGVLARVPLSDDNEGVAKAALEGLKAKGVEAAGGGAKAEPAGGAAAGAASAAAAPKAGGKVIFVLGGPGTGKGTQCGKLAEKYACAHFSAGDLLREEVKKGSEQGQMISDMIRDGKIVPAQVTLDLLKAAMAARDGPYLIDGFPRSADNVSAFDEQCGVCALVLLFVLTEE
jgi:adenylate kinase family enzyme